MGTRGAFGVITGEIEKIAYNHFDSYISGKGIEILKWLRAVIEEDRLDEIRALAEKLQVVDDDRSPATPEQILALREFSDWHVGQYPISGPPGDELPTENVEWYNLLRQTQGDPSLILACGYIEDGSDFPLDSLFCEWAYIVDLDRGVFEVYQGFQNTLPISGRWAGRPTAEEDKQNYEKHIAWSTENGRPPYRPEVSEYKAVELIASYPFDALATNEEFLALDREEKEVTA